MLPMLPLDRRIFLHQRRKRSYWAMKEGELANLISTRVISWALVIGIIAAVSWTAIVAG